MEKIDRTRGHAAQLFAKLLTSPLDIPHIPRKNEVLLCFPEKLRQPGKVMQPNYWYLDGFLINFLFNLNTTKHIENAKTGSTKHRSVFGFESIREIFRSARV